jgi:hypothetical protein
LYESVENSAEISLLPTEISSSNSTQKKKFFSLQVENIKIPHRQLSSLQFIGLSVLLIVLTSCIILTHEISTENSRHPL